jgi:hypothetical protein
MFANGYVNETVYDEGRCKFVTEFEKMLPLRQISLEEYEERLYRNLTPAMEEKASVELIVESFKDHWAFRDISVPFTLTRELMFDRLFLVENDSSEIIADSPERKTDRQTDDEDDGLSGRVVDVTTLFLLGILYCRSNRRQRADRFFDIIDMDDAKSIKASDKAFRAYVPYIYEISYKLMFRLYERHRDQAPGENGAEPLQPEVDVKRYLTMDYEMDHNLKMKFVSRFEGHLFQAMNRLDKERCINRLEKNVFNLL